jgi:hypothetical protein
MARVPNPLKQFQFGIFIPGMDQFLAQEVKTADDGFEVAEHGDTGHKIKTAGLREVGNLQVTKIMPSTGLDFFMQAWMNRIRNFVTGGGELPSQYKEAIIVEEYSADGLTVVSRTIYEGCWPMKRNGIDLNRAGSQNTTESLEFCIDRIAP